MTPQPNNLPRISLDQAISSLESARISYELYNADTLVPTERSRSARLMTDTRKFQNSDAFLAIKGNAVDGHQRIPSLIHQRPAYVIVEDASIIETLPQHLPVILVPSTRAAWAYLCATAYGNPQKHLKIFGVTGTNGKTSTVWHLRQLFSAFGKEVLSIGTLGIWLGETFVPATHTTPDPPDLFSLMAQAVTRGINYVVMEVSSHSLAQQKVAPLSFAAAAFTSFSQDHLDFHLTMDEYLREKMRLFTELTSPDTRIYLAGGLPQDIIAKIGDHATIYGCQIDKTFAAKRHFGLKVLGTGPNGTRCIINDEDEFVISLVGDFALENFLAASLMVHDELKVDLPKLISHPIKQVPGRLELISIPTARDHPTVIVDYAHTPDALEKTIATLKSINSQGEVWVIFGCGGDRDRSKRPLMAAAVAKSADHIIVTSDNPRFEDPEQIMNDAYQGIPKTFTRVKLILERDQAIVETLRQAMPDDIVLIAGKGHEDYIEVRGVRTPYNDRTTAELALRILYA